MAAVETCRPPACRIAAGAAGICLDRLARCLALLSIGGLGCAGTQNLHHAGCGRGFTRLASAVGANPCIICRRFCGGGAGPLVALVSRFLAFFPCGLCPDGALRLVGPVGIYGWRAFSGLDARAARSDALAVAGHARAYAAIGHAL